MQSAFDRDNYVKINKENMPDAAKHNFNKYGDDEVSHFGETYDYNSVMHYDAYGFSVNGEPTIEPIVRLNSLATTFSFRFNQFLPILNARIKNT